MIQTAICPACESDELHVLKAHQFVLPETKELDPLTGDGSYRYERLWILFEKIWQKKDPVEFEVTSCRKCGLIFTNPRFSAEEIAVKYQTISRLESARKRNQTQPALRTKQRAKRIYSLIDPLLEKSGKPRKVLDYGGAQGYNLIPFCEAGDACYLVDYVGYDYPKGITYLGKDIDNISSDELFDIILFCHTLEHVIEPVGLLEKLSSRLSENGCIYVEVPLGCWKEWEWLSEPLTHVNFFSEESLVNCLHNAGLHPIYLSTSYQWLIREREWCINTIATRQPGQATLIIRTTQQQMQASYYLIRRILDRPKFYANIAMKKLLNVVRIRKQ